MIYDVSYKALIEAKSLRIKFDKVDGFIRVDDGNRYLELIGPKKVVLDMLFFHNYEKNDVSKGNDFSQTNESKEWIISRYWYFLDEGSLFQPNVWNDFYRVLLMSINLSDIAVLNIHGAYYWCIINEISTSEAISLMQNIDLTDLYTGAL